MRDQTKRLIRTVLTAHTRLTRPFASFDCGCTCGWEGPTARFTDHVAESVANALKEPK